MQDIFTDTLDVAVPLRIKNMKENGGPTKEQMTEAQDFSDVLGERGDILLFGGGKKGECADMFNNLANSIAILSFCPGGVDLFGRRWDSDDERYNAANEDNQV